jgi:hypothetical protein
MIIAAMVPGSLLAAVPSPCSGEGGLVELPGDRVLFGQDLTVARCERIGGDVVMFFGDARIDGAIGGDIVVLFGDLNLSSTAQVDGDAVVTSGSMTVDPGARLHGDRGQLPELGKSAGALVSKLSTGPNAASEPIEASLDIQGSRSLSNPLASQPLWLRLATALLGSLLIFIVGHFFLWIAPLRARNLRRTLEASPGTSLLMGGIVCLALGLISALLIVSIVGWLALPFVGLGAAVLTALGMGGLLEALGDRLPLPLRLRSRSSDLIAGAVLVAGLSCLWAFGGTAGSLAGLALGAMGWAAIGASVLSSVGKRAYSRA